MTAPVQVPFRLYVYYKVPVEYIEKALKTSKALIKELNSQRLAKGEVLKRIQSGKPYATVMETFTPLVMDSSLTLEQQLDQFTQEVTMLGDVYFSVWENIFIRISEPFFLVF